MEGLRPVSLRLPLSTVSKIRKYAKEQDRSVNWVMTKMANDFCRCLDAKPKNREMTNESATEGN